MVEAFLTYVADVHGRTKATCDGYKYHLKKYQAYCDALQVSIFSVNKQFIYDFLDSMDSGNNHKYNVLNSIRQFYNFCVYSEYMQENPALYIQNPQRPPKVHNFIPLDNIIRLISSVNTSTPIGLRNRTIIELFFLTGMRSSELSNLRLFDIDFIGRTAKVFGKGNKERLIPLNDVAIQSLNRYLDQRSDIFAKHQETNNFVFMTRKSGAGPMKPNTIWVMVKNHARSAGLDEHFTTHTLRHAFATHLLHNGANLRVVQQLLGHAKISTTQLYTNLPDQHLKKLHRQFHPRAK